MEMESVTPLRLKKPTLLRPPTFSNREKTDAKQKQGDNSQACTVLLLFSQKHRHAAMQKTTKEQNQNSQRISLSGTALTRTTMTTLITALILAGLVFWLMVATPVVLHRWSPETSGGRSDPVLPSSGETVILSAPQKAPAAAARSVYRCTASNIHQMPSLYCDVRQSAFHRLSNEAETSYYLTVSKKKIVQIIKQSIQVSF